jgi:ATP adenylyltransferase
MGWCRRRMPETLFTPWRFDYLTQPRPDTRAACFFCEAGRREPSEELLTLYIGERVLVMLNRFPYTNGHLMVAPRSHDALLHQSEKSILCDLIAAAAEGQRILSTVYGPDGFNIGMNFGSTAGAGVSDHYHLHVVPRWSGDHNFMSVTASTRIVPEALDVTWSKLRPKFAELEKDSSNA